MSLESSFTSDRNIRTGRNPVRTYPGKIEKSDSRLLISAVAVKKISGNDTPRESVNDLRNRDAPSVVRRNFKVPGRSPDRKFVSIRDLQVSELWKDMSSARRRTRIAEQIEADERMARYFQLCEVEAASRRCISEPPVLRRSTVMRKDSFVEQYVEVFPEIQESTTYVEEVDDFRVDFEDFCREMPESIAYHTRKVCERLWTKTRHMPMRDKYWFMIEQLQKRRNPKTKELSYQSLFSTCPVVDELFTEGDDVVQDAPRVEKRTAHEPAYTVKDLSSRFARYQIKGFSSTIVRNWNVLRASGMSAKAVYLSLCAKYDVSPSGWTSQIPSVRHVLNLCKRNAFAESMRTCISGVMLQNEPASDLWAMLCEHPILKLKFLIKFGYQLGFHPQGATQSSVGEVNRTSEEAAKARHAAGGIGSCAPLVFFTLVQGLQEQVYKAFNRTMPISSNISDYVLLWNLIKSQTRNEWVVNMIGFMDTTLYVNFVGQLQFTLQDIILYLFGEFEIPAAVAVAPALVAGMLGISGHFDTGTFALPVNGTPLGEGLHGGIPYAEGGFHEQGSDNPILGEFKKIRHSPLVAKTVGFLTFLVGSHFVDESDALKAMAISATRVQNITGSVVDGFIALTDLLLYWKSRFELVARTRDWRDFFEADPATIALAELDKCLSELETRNSKDIRWVVNEARKALSKHQHSKNAHVSKAWERVRDSLQSYIEGFKSTREKPVGIILFGKPGVGKTIFADQLSAAYAGVLGIPPEIEIVHVLTKTKHQKLSTCVYILVDNDTFSLNDELTLQSTGIALLDKYQSFLDTTALRLEAASIADKDNSLISPDFVVLNTNAMAYSITTSMSGKDKLDRRYWTCHVQLKPAYIAKFESEEAAYRYFAKNYRPHCLMYTVGRMQNSDNAEAIYFEPIDDITIFQEPDEVIKFLFEQLAFTRSEKQKVVFEGCPRCHLRGAACVCGIECNGKPMFPEPVVVEEKPSAFSWPTAPWGGLPDKVQLHTDALTRRLNGESLPGDPKFEDFEFQQQGATISVQHTVPDATLIAIDNSALRVVKVATGAVAALLALSALLEWLRTRFKEQGNIVSHLTNVVPDPSIKIDPYISTKQPWLGKSSLNLPVTLINPRTNKYLSGVFITDSLLCTAHHFIRDSQFGDNITIKYGDSEKVFVLSNDNFYRYKTWDLVFLYIPGLACVYDPAYEHLPVDIGYPTGKAYFKDIEVKNITPDRAVTGIEADAPHTKDGECGSPLYDSQGFIYGILTGFYKADLRRQFMPLSKKIIREVMAAFEVKGVGIHPRSNELPPAFTYQEGGAGFVPDVPHPKGDAFMMEKWTGRSLRSCHHLSFGHTSSKETLTCNVEKTPYYEVFEGREYGPPFLGKHVQVSPGVWKSPVIKRIEAQKSEAAIPHHHIENAMLGMLNDMTTVAKLTPLDLYTAVCGSEINVLINSRDNTKSIGDTAKIVHKLVNKTAFRPTDKEGEFVIDSKIVDGVKRYVDNAMGEDPLLIPYVKACKKSELKPTEKAAAGDCRLFYLSDVEFNLAFRMLVLPLIALIMKNFLESGCFSTLNAGSEQWKALYRYLERFCDPEEANKRREDVIEGDQAAYDLKQRELQVSYARFMKRLALKNGYTEREARGVERIILMSQYYMLDLLRDFFLCTMGLNSGLPDTLVRNSMIMKKCFYIILSKKGVLVNGLIDGKPPRESVAMANTGDDNLTTMVKWIRLTGKEVTDGFKALGYDITNSDKKPGDIILRDLRDCTYLKRSFNFMEYRGRQYCFASLSKDSIFKSVRFRLDCQKGMEEERDAGAIMSAAREMFLYGREEYDAFCAKVCSVAHFEFLTFDELLDEFDMNVFRTWEVGTCKCRKLVDREPISDDGSRELIHQSSNGDHPPNNLATDGRLVYQFAITELNSSSEQEVFGHNVVTNIASTNFEAEAEKPGALGPREVPNDVSLAEFFKRPRKIWTVPTGLASNSLPIFATWLALPPVNVVLKQWSLFRGDATLTIVITGGAQFNGLYRFYAYPNRAIHGTYEDSIVTPASLSNGFQDTNFCLTSQLPHVDIDLALAGTYELKLPFCLPREYIVTDGFFELWTLFYVPVNIATLASGTTAPAMNIDVFVHYDNVKLDVLVPQSGEADKITLSNGLSYASRLASYLPLPWASPFSRLLGAGADMAKHLGWARPPSEPQTAMIMRMNDNPSLMGGQPDFSITLASNPAVVRNITQPIPLSEPNETKLSVLSKRSAMIVAEWSGTPIPIMAGTSTNMSRGEVLQPSFQMTPMAFAASNFRYWSGSISVCVQVVCSALLRARIGLVILPPGVAAPASYPTNGDYLTTVMDITGSTCTEVKVPYLFQEPFQFFSIIGTKSPPITTTRIMYFYLSTTTSLGTNVLPHINLWIKAGDDFSMGVPSLTEVNRYSLKQIGVPPAFAPELEEFSDPMFKEQSGVGVMSSYYFGEVFETLEELSRRKVKCLSFTPNNELTDGFVAIPVQPSVPGYYPTPAKFLLLSDMWNFASWVSVPFLGMTGSYDYKIQVENGEAPQFITVCNDLVVPGSVQPVLASGMIYNGTSPGASAFSIRTTPFAEVRCVDRNPYQFRLPNTYIVESGPKIECVVIDSTAVMDRAWSVWIGGGDDLTFKGFLCAPEVYLRY